MPRQENATNSGDQTNRLSQKLDSGEAHPAGAGGEPHGQGRALAVGLREWALLATTVVLFGSSFAMTKISLETIPVVWVFALRSWSASALLVGLLYLSGKSLPPLITREGGGMALERRWLAMGGVGLSGMAAPALLIVWAQQYVESGLAGIYLALTPITTLILAHFFTDDRMNGPKAVGFAFGFAGTVILISPNLAPSGGGEAGSHVWAHIGLLSAALLFAAAGILARNAPMTPPQTAGTIVVLTAAIASTPALLFSPPQFAEWSAGSVIATILAGLLGTATNAVAFMALISRAGPGFASLGNYLTPLWAIGVGAMLFGERLPLSTFIAFGVIILGLALSQGRQIEQLIRSKRNPSP